MGNATLHLHACDNPAPQISWMLELFVQGNSGGLTSGTSLVIEAASGVVGVGVVVEVTEVIRVDAGSVDDDASAVVDGDGDSSDADEPGPEHPTPGIAMSYA